MNTNGNLGRALSKVEHCYGPRWCGYLTPSEILELVKAGAIPEHPGGMQYIEMKHAKGQCRPNWFYFTAREQLVPLLPIKDHKKVGTAAKM